MHKKIMTACFALLALAAFALPAAAQAVNHPVVTHPTGTTLATGTKILGVNTLNTLLVTTTGETKLTCTSAKMTGTLTSNTTGNVQGTISSAEFKGSGSGEACTGIFNAVVDPESLPWCLKSTEAMGTDEFQVSGGECGKAPTKIKFTLTVFGSTTQKCVYESTETTAVRGEFTTDVSGGDAVLTTPRAGGTLSTDSGFVKITDDTIGSLCPTSSALKMTFTLKTDNALNEPLYISE
jgi:hypothetical protein